MNVCGERIRARRKELGMTQAQLAEKLYISNKAVSKWETGESNPDIALLPRLAEILEMSTDELLGRSSNTPPAVTLLEKSDWTVRDGIKQTVLVVCAMLCAMLSLLLFGSGLLAFNQNMVLSTTGDLSMQPFLIGFSLFLAIVFLMVLLCLVKPIRRSFRIRREQTSRRYADQGYIAFADLTKETKRRLMKEFRKNEQMLIVLDFVCLAVALIAFGVAFMWETYYLLARIVSSVAVFCAGLIGAILSVRKQNFLLEKQIYNR